MARLRLTTLVLSVLGAATARAELLPVAMEAYEEIGQTTVFRADLSGADGTIRAVAIKDLNRKGGSSGVFSGFDVDFVVFDRDGDFHTQDDRILPIENPLTFVGNDGVVRKGLNSIYKPTAAHPGRLFGLNQDGSIDFATATLGLLDAVYLPGVENLTVDTSHGWVSLGDGGSMRVAFPLISVTAEDSLFLFLGDVGPKDEFTDGLSEIQLFVGAQNIRLLDPNAPHDVELGPNERLNLDATPEGVTAEVVDWAWDLDGDGVYDDGSGQVLGVSFDHFVNTLGLPLGQVDIGLQTTLSDGDQESFTFGLTLVPEPATAMLLVGLGAPLLLRRRRKA